MKPIRQSMLHKYLKYITPYRAMLIALLLPGIVMVCMGGASRSIFLKLYMGLAVLTFVVELLLFVFQFTRRENFWTELLLLVVLVAGGLFL